MSQTTKNRVREQRKARDLSQIELAARANLTRQSIGAIEAGRSMPAVDVALRIARALDCQVEELFGAPEGVPTVDVELIGTPSASRLALALVRERWVGLSLTRDVRTAADALVVETRGRRATVAPLRSLAESRDNLVLMGCAPALGLLADRLQTQHGGARFLWLPSSTDAALRALASGQTHVAGVHCVSTDATTDPNVVAVRHARGSEAVALITMARWEVGLLTRSGDDRVRSIADVAAPGVRLVAREQGASARALLEERLREAGVGPEVMCAAPVVALGHLDVARAIDMGAADVGVATRDAALAFGLCFVPLAEERYDLVVPVASLDNLRVRRLFDVMTAKSTRRELESLGYDVRSSGDRVADVEAA